VIPPLTQGDFLVLTLYAYNNVLFIMYYSLFIASSS
jgi:hypothetical protein